VKNFSLYAKKLSGGVLVLVGIYFAVSLV